MKQLLSWNWNCKYTNTAYGHSYFWMKSWRPLLLGQCAIRYTVILCYGCSLKGGSTVHSNSLNLKKVTKPVQILKRPPFGRGLIKEDVPHYQYQKWIWVMMRGSVEVRTFMKLWSYNKYVFGQSTCRKQPVKHLRIHDTCALKRPETWFWCRFCDAI